MAWKYLALSGNRSPAVSMRRVPGQQRIKQDELPAPPLELQRVLLQGPCRPSWVNHTSTLHAASWFGWWFG